MIIADTTPYIRMMEDIKRRIEVVFSFQHGHSHALYAPTTIESTVLQIRMITELIALASLSANKELFDQGSSKFRNHWNPNDIIKDLRKINPNFYPKPIRETLGEDGIVDHVKVDDGYMTEDELVETHGLCGNLLHAKNPFGKQINYKIYQERIPEWTGRIIKLLNFHEIRLLGSDHFHYVVMETDGIEGVQMYTFEHKQTPQSTSSGN